MTQSVSDLEDAGDPPFLDEFITDITLQGFTDKTVKSYESNVRTFLDWYDDDPRELDRGDLKGFLMHLTDERERVDGTVGLAPGTVDNYFSRINGYYKYLRYEGVIEENIVPDFQERYVEAVTYDAGSTRQLISIEEMATLVHGTLKVRDRAIIVLLAKTGIRKNELVSMDLEDIDWEEQSILLKETPKRTNRLVFFDGECHRVLERWLRVREEEDPETEAVFTNQYGDRLKGQGVYQVVIKHAEKVGFHNTDTIDLQERYTPHCCRHWFTTHLRRAGMPREFIQELRGDTRGDAIDLYDHIDRDELRESYLAHIPSLGL